MPDGFLEYKDRIPQLVAGTFHPKYRNFYAFGIHQARYGAGPLITVGAESLSRTVKVQSKLKYPISVILQTIGLGKTETRSQKSADILSDPHVLLKRSRMSQQMSSWWPFIESTLIKLGKLK